MFFQYNYEYQVYSPNGNRWQGGYSTSIEALKRCFKSAKDAGRPFRFKGSEEHSGNECPNCGTQIGLVDKFCSGQCNDEFRGHGY